MLQYHLSPNPLTPDPNDYSAQVTNVEVLSIEQIVDRMLHRGTLLTKADILAVVEVYNSEIGYVVEEGKGVNTPIVNIFPSISGVFNGAIDVFDPNRHTVKSNLNTGSLLRKMAANIKTQKIDVADAVPHVVEVRDISSSTVNDVITVGGVVELRGSRLKFSPEESTNGVFLIGEGGTEVACTMTVENKPARLIVVLPQSLAKGSYYLEVRTTYSGNVKQSKTLKTGRFHKLLTV